jgi:hypothetical protein
LEQKELHNYDEYDFCLIPDNHKGDNHKENTLYLSKTKDGALQYSVLKQKELLTGTITQKDVPRSDLSKVSGSDLAEFQKIKDVILKITSNRNHTNYDTYKQDVQDYQDLLLEKFDNKILSTANNLDQSNNPTLQKVLIILIDENSSQNKQDSNPAPEDRSSFEIPKPVTQASEGNGFCNKIKAASSCCQTFIVNQIKYDNSLLNNTDLLNQLSNRLGFDYVLNQSNRIMLEGNGHLLDEAIIAGDVESLLTTIDYTDC